MRLLAMVLAFAAFLASCETVKGVGRDVTNAGEALDDAVDDD